MQGPPFGESSLEATVLAVRIIGVPVPDSAVAVGGAVLIGTLIALSAFFSSSEIAMFSLADHRVETLVNDAVPGSQTLKELKDDPHRLLVTILVGNNLVNIAMSSIATGLLVMLGVGQGQSVAFATFGITALVLLFGESAPKSYAVENSESWALRIAKPLKFSEYFLFPLVVLFDYLTRLINSVTGGRTSIETSYVTREEIREMIETGEREGVLDEDEHEMFQRIFRFDNTIAKEAMTPRLDITGVNRDDNLNEAIMTCIRSGHQRLPVYENSLDNIIGAVTLSDLVGRCRCEEGSSNGLDHGIEEVLQVPESKNVDDLFEEMRRETVEMAVVKDEFGTTEGIITTEDLVEEIVGDLIDAEEEDPITILDETSVIVRGDVNIEAINDTLDTDLPEEGEFETIAGFVFNRAGRLVEAGESFSHRNLDIRVDRVDTNRIKRVQITERHDEPSTNQPVESQS
ncbi:DNA-binding protein [Halorubrum ezzemoulense DSM 17463]|jgi:CBS domain containing-hemolysin-like protein|uniref:DNA-binding protein n=1 Tax=Halorubrum ezzemoulense DSM 17463 TaxID=1121945 RepID=A0A1X4G962_HALEZ|nr:hemolysin family protein [Halorubrum ezzemoulense]MDB2272595.1 hemolysin family protein [Halorubrum ezzemoulense]OSO93342.1 DNA-binding protein [Halorubrum ezzemoulense DSM 17463]